MSERLLQLHVKAGSRIQVTIYENKKQKTKKSFPALAEKLNKSHI